MVRRAHGRQHAARQVGRAEDVGLDDAVEDLRRDILEAPVRRNARRLDDGVDAPVLRARGGHRGVDGDGIADIETDGLCRGGAAGQALGRRVLQRFQRPGDEHQVVAALGELVDDGPSDAAGGTGDDDDARAAHGFRTTFTQPSSFFWKMS